MDPIEFIDLSGKMVSHGRAGARTAVSRAYYGAFHLALSFLRGLECAPSANARGHDLVPKFLRSSGNADALDAANLLGNLYSNRIRADYRLHDPKAETQQFAQVGVEMAHEIRRRLEAFEAACRAPAIREDFQTAVAKVKEAHGIP